MFESEVDRGVQLLTNEVGPRWFAGIDLDRLDLNDVHDCVLGQLFGHYGEGCQKFWAEARVEEYRAKYGIPLSTELQDHKAAHYGLNLSNAYSEHTDGDLLFAELTNEWVRQIRLLRECITERV